ncbi:MAG: hypothetical protein M1296_07905 [Chloroflexi bacterium]|nr:hypothetical protein [Chloroflexota bacterium]
MTMIAFISLLLPIRETLFTYGRRAAAFRSLRMRSGSIYYRKGSAASTPLSTRAQRQPEQTTTLSLICPALYACAAAADTVSGW